MSELGYCNIRKGKDMVKKIVKLADYSYAYNSLTNFEYEVNVMTGNGK